MNILSHRGYWISEHEKNSLGAFERSFSFGFGIETDVRDFNGELVISHDLATSESISLELLFDLYCKFPARPKIALNIKADGLQSELKRQLTTFGIDNYFVFDMSVPDSLIYLAQGMITYTRQSEYELIPPYYSSAQGVWLDEFNKHWLNDEVIKGHIFAGKTVCIVSPELHKRPYELEWEQYRRLEKKLGGGNSMFLCTDLPEVAEDFFNA